LAKIFFSKAYLPWIAKIFFSILSSLTLFSKSIAHEIMQQGKTTCVQVKGLSGSLDMVLFQYFYTSKSGEFHLLIATG